MKLCKTGKRDYIEVMAALAQPVPLEATIREALASLPLPDGVALKSVQFRGNSHGEPSVYVTYGYAQKDKSDEEQANILLKVIPRALDVLRTLDLPLFEYIKFEAV